MYPEELSNVEETFAYLSAVTATPPGRPNKSLNANHVESVIQVLDRWPSSQRFPGNILALILRILLKYVLPQ